MSVVIFTFPHWVKMLTRKVFHVLSSFTTWKAKSSLYFTLLLYERLFHVARRTSMYVRSFQSSFECLFQSILAINLDDVIDITPYIKVLEENDAFDGFKDLKFSDFKIRSLESFNDTDQNFEIAVLNNDSTELSSMLDEYIPTLNNNNDQFFDIPQGMFG